MNDKIYKNTEDFIRLLNDNESYLISIAERAFLETLQGGCQVPIGAYSEVTNNKITLYGIVVSLDGKQIVKDSLESNLDINSSKKLGKLLAERLLQNGGDKILKEIPHLHQDLS